MKSASSCTHYHYESYYIDYVSWSFLFKHKYPIVPSNDIAWHLIICSLNTFLLKCFDAAFGEQIITN